MMDSVESENRIRANVDLAAELALLVRLLVVIIKIRHDSGGTGPAGSVADLPVLLQLVTQRNWPCWFGCGDSTYFAKSTLSR